MTLQFGNYANYVGAHFWNLQVGHPTQPTLIPLPTSDHHQELNPGCSGGQDELLGYTSRDEWAGYTSVLNHDILYATGEDRNVSADPPRVAAVVHTPPSTP